MGTMDVSYMALNTLWGFDSDELFDSFEANRQAISYRLQDRAEIEADRLGVTYLEGDHPEDIGYANGFGRQSTDVLIPAFLATYRGESPMDVDLSINDRVMALDYIPAPNWTLNYNGLSKLKWFEDIFSSFTLKHGYRSSMTVSSFNSDPDFNATNPFQETQLQSLNYYTRFDVPQIVISEEFVPVIGINFSTKSAFDFNAEYRKSRNLAMDFYAKELVESKAEEFTIGAGLILEDVNIPFLTGVKNSKKGSKKKPDPNAKKSSNGSNGKGIGGFGKVTNSKGTNMTFKLDFSFRDDVVQNRTIDQTSPFIPTRGIRSWRANPSVDYDVNDNVNLRLFYDYSRSVPATTNSFPITNWQTGLTIRLNLGELI
jgi:cell surface protein SprA